MESDTINKSSMLGREEIKRENTEFRVLAGSSKQLCLFSMLINYSENLYRGRNRPSLYAPPSRFHVLCPMFPPPLDGMGHPPFLLPLFDSSLPEEDRI